MGLAAGAAGAAALAACGSDGPSNSGGGSSGGGSGGGAASYWSLSGPPGEPVRKASVKRFNDANPDTKISELYFQNDAYKQKIKTSLGANQGPTMIWGWGGGGLKEYVSSNLV